MARIRKVLPRGIDGFVNAGDKEAFRLNMTSGSVGSERGETAVRAPRCSSGPPFGGLEGWKCRVVGHAA